MCFSEWSPTCHSTSHWPSKSSSCPLAATTRREDWVSGLLQICCDHIISYNSHSTNILVWWPANHHRSRAHCGTFGSWVLATIATSPQSIGAVTLQMALPSTVQHGLTVVTAPRNLRRGCRLAWYSLGGLLPRRRDTSADSCSSCFVNSCISFDISSRCRRCCQTILLVGVPMVYCHRFDALVFLPVQSFLCSFHRLCWLANFKASRLLCKSFINGLTMNEFRG